MGQPTAANRQSGAPGSGRRRRLRFGRTLTYLVLVSWTVVTLFPIAWVYMQSFKPPEETYVIPPKFVFVPTLDNYREVLGLKVPKELEGLSQQEARTLESKFPGQAVNSLVITAGAVVLSLALATLAAYPLARMRVGSKATILGAITATRLVPTVVLVLPIYVMWRALGLTDTHLGMILVYLTTMLPFSIWLMYGFLLDIPLDLEEAAMVDGCSRFGACYRVVLPLAAPGLAVTAIFTLIFVWNEFLLASMLTANNVTTLTVGITQFVTEKAILWGRLYAASALLLLPLLLFSLLVQKQLARGITAGAVKG